MVTNVLKLEIRSQTGLESTWTRTKIDNELKWFDFNELDCLNIQKNLQLVLGMPNGLFSWVCLMVYSGREFYDYNIETQPPSCQQ